MGAWGFGHFENDTACDWVYDLEQSNDMSAISEAIEAVFEDEYIDSDVGCQALAAIDTVARLLGQSGVKSSYTESVDDWVENYAFVPSKDLIEKSRNALDLVLGESSELLELWADTEEFDAWKSEVMLLRDRINQSVNP